MAPELWGFIGTLIGAGASMGVTWVVARVGFSQAWKQSQDQDLRELQEAVLKAIDTLEAETGWVSRVGLDEVLGREWLPVNTHQAIQHASMIAVRVQNQQVQKCWTETEKHLRNGLIQLQTGILAADPDNPLLKRMAPYLAPEVPMLIREKAVEIFDSALIHAVRARKSHDAFTDAVKQAFQNLRSV